MEASKTSTMAQRRAQSGEMSRSGESEHDLIHHLKKFAEENPTSAAMWCLGIGFVLGWKLKPW